MNNYAKFRLVAMTLFTAFTVSYVLCIAAGALFGWTMVTVWSPLMPGFTWPLTFIGFLVGVIWLIVYSLYGAAIFVFPYSYFATKQHQ